MTTLRSLLILFLLLPIAGRLPAQCRASAFGKPCGATLAGAIAGSALRLSLTVPGNTGGVLVVGLRRIAFTLPAGCILYTDPLAILPYTAGPLGTVTWNVPIPTGTRGTGYVQAIPILPARPGVIYRGSNGVEVVCP